MKKQKIGIVVAIVILLFIGIFSVTLSKGNFFFTTKYYSKAIDAYNAECTYNAVYGDTTVEKEIGLFLLDNENCLFIGEINENCFAVNEMKIKNGRYASEGSTFFYDLREPSDRANSNSTNTANGCVKWAAVYSQEEIDQLSNAASVDSFTNTNGCDIYIVMYKN